MSTNPLDLRAIRETLGMSQSQFASALGISIRALQSYEQGWRGCPPTVGRLAGLLLQMFRTADRKPAKPCWEIKKCPTETRQKCLAHQFGCGQFCWLITGNYREGKAQKTSKAKLSKCTSCTVMTSWLKP